MTRALAIDEGVNNVRVNSISPGGIWTPLFEDWVNASSDPKKTLQCEEDQQHIRRLGTIEECGKLHSSWRAMPPTQLELTTSSAVAASLAMETSG